MFIVTDKKRAGEIIDIKGLPIKERVKILFEQKEITPIEALIELAMEEAEGYFINDIGEFFASIDVNGITKNVNIEKQTFKMWLRRIFYHSIGKPPTEHTIKETVNTIMALEDGKVNNRISAPTRIAKINDVIYVDLGHDSGQYVKIDKEGWQLVKSTPIKFVRPSTFLSLPIPERNGDINELKKILTVDEDHFALIMGYLLGCYNVGSPYPILILQGGQGSAKSTTAELVKYLVDNSFPLLRWFPKNEEDLIISTQTNWVLAFDNLSNITPSMSDALCKISTGGGLATRKFYENGEEVVFSAMRPIILNGIDYIAYRPDLADRSIIIHLPIIPEDKRRGKKEVWKQFHSICPSIMGVIFDAVSLAIREQDKIKLKRIPRMADFATWVTAAEPALGLKRGTFLKIYKENQTESKLDGLEQDLLGIAISKCLDQQKTISGSATEILEILSKYVPPSSLNSKEWLTTPNKFRNKINRIQPLLDAQKIAYEYVRTAQERKHILRKLS
jgi:hypothetical protein